MMKTATPVLPALVVIAAVAVFFYPPPAGTPVTVMHAAGLLVLVMGFWATGALPEFLTGLIFFLLAVLFAIARPEVIFSGFASGTLWLVLGGLVMAEAVRATGLGERFARAVLGHRTLSYPALIGASVFVSVALAFIMPATIGRVLLLLPILTAVARRHGLEAGSAGYSGVCLATILATFQCGTAILPANAPNLVLAGAAETLYGVHLVYAGYLWAQFPVLGVLKGIVIVALTVWLFPDTTRLAEGAADASPMSAEEKRLAVILASALVLWATDFAHGIRPGWVALGAAVVAMLPRIGAVPVSVFQDRVRFGAFFYIGAILGLGAVMLETGLSDALGRALLGVIKLEPGSDALNFSVLSLLATFAGLITTNPSQPALLAPFAEVFAHAAGWPIKPALMIMAVGFSTLILPYQVPPVLVGVQLANLPLKTTLRLTVPLAAASIFLLLPLQYLWWRYIGYFG